MNAPLIQLPHVQWVERVDQVELAVVCMNSCSFAKVKQLSFKFWIILGAKALHTLVMGKNKGFSDIMQLCVWAGIKTSVYVSWP